VTVSVVDSLIAFAQNVALLLALTLLYSAMRPWLAQRRALHQALLAGVLFGLIAIAGMHTPIVVAPGVIADARLIPILLAGPFGGGGAALIAGVLPSGYRLLLGGAGAWAGVGTILTTSALGAAVSLRYRRRRQPLTPLTFVALGVALDVIVLGWSLALPHAALARQVLGAASIPVGLFLPLGTLVLGTLLVREDRRHAERERLTLMHASLEHSAEAVLWIDATGRVVNVNPAAATLTGWQPDTLVAMRLWELDVGLSLASWDRYWARARETRHIALDSRYRQVDGSEIPVETSADFVEYRGQQWLSVFVRDITERLRAERERTEHLAQEQALRVQAEEANILKDQFLATLSHELRTPLTSILGYTTMLRAGSLHGPAVTRALEVIERNTLVQARIVDDLLDVSSIVLRKLRIERQPIDLGPIVEDEVEAIRVQAEMCQLTLRCLVEQNMPPVLGDVGRVRQVVANLLSNAVKFTAPGDRITVRMERSGPQARIVVQDTGRGIERAFLPHVFDRFRQADSTLTRQHGGLGLGLAIVRHLVELHDGTVMALSDGVGKGATFIVTLPLLTAAREVHIPARAARPRRLA
jgi:PAS domain S-box-containing protein